MDGSYVIGPYGPAPHPNVDTHLREQAQSFALAESVHGCAILGQLHRRPHSGSCTRPRSRVRCALMKYLTDDVRITGMQEVVAPQALIDALPLDDAASEVVFNARREIGSIVKGTDTRLMVVVGPCSIHDPVAALEYAERLAESAERHREQLKIVMRVYFEKPRTTVGWKGLINDPRLDGSFAINEGLRRARRLAVRLRAPRPPARGVCVCAT